MHHFEMVSVTAILRTIDRRGRMPLRIRQVAPSVVRIESVAAMYAGLLLDLGVGSHTGQGTRHGPKSVLISDRRRAVDVSQNTWRATQSNAVYARRVYYFPKLTHPSSILTITEISLPAKSPVAHCVSMLFTPQPPSRVFHLRNASVPILARPTLCAAGTRVAHSGVTSSTSKLISPWAGQAARIRRDGAPQE
jgi:hypothetical protein